jgi:hypothetical protein
MSFGLFTSIVRDVFEMACSKEQWDDFKRMNTYNKFVAIVDPNGSVLKVDCVINKSHYDGMTLTINLFQLYRTNIDNEHSS